MCADDENSSTTNTAIFIRLTAIDANWRRERNARERGRRQLASAAYARGKEGLDLYFSDLHVPQCLQTLVSTDDACGMLPYSSNM